MEGLVDSSVQDNNTLHIYKLYGIHNVSHNSTIISVQGSPDKAVT